MTIKTITRSGISVVRDVLIVLISLLSLNSLGRLAFLNPSTK